MSEEKEISQAEFDYYLAAINPNTTDLNVEVTGPLSKVFSRALFLAYGKPSPELEEAGDDVRFDKDNPIKQEKAASENQYHMSITPAGEINGLESLNRNSYTNGLDPRILSQITGQELATGKSHIYALGMSHLSKEKHLVMEAAQKHGNSFMVILSFDEGSPIISNIISERLEKEIAYYGGLVIPVNIW